MIDFNKIEPQSSHWQYKGSFDFEVPVGAFGFVYRIEQINPEPDQPFIYIGRKYLSRSKTSSKRVSLKNGSKVTKKKKSRVESDWRSYTGSCGPLNESIKRLGKENFKFEILCFANTKGQVNFAEEFVQMRAGVIFDDSFFNDSIGARGFIGVKFTTEFKEILRGINL